jgi:hypothetical protein
MADGSSVRSPGRLAGLACLAIILASSLGCLAMTRLLSGVPGAPFGYAAYFGSPWPLVVGAGEPAVIQPLVKNVGDSK